MEDPGRRPRDPAELARAWTAARRALSEGVAFLDAEGRVVDCDARFAELLRALVPGAPSADALTERPLAELLHRPEFAPIHRHLSSPPRSAESEAFLLAGRGFAVRVVAWDHPRPERAVVLERLHAADLDDDADELRDQLAMRDELLAAQQLLITELVAPIIPVFDDLVAVPFVGALEDESLERIVERLSDTVSQGSARTVVLDLTGVTQTDESAGDGLSRLHRTLAMLGAELVLTGVGAELAEILCDAELPALTIRKSLEAALRAHLQRASKIQPPGPSAVISKPTSRAPPASAAARKDDA